MLVASGCKALFQTASVAEKPRPTVVGTVRVSGPGTCLPLLKALAADYRKINPGIRVLFLPEVHSGGGVKGVAAGSLDIGAISRPLEPKERKLGLSCTWLSTDALAVAANVSAKAAGLTSAQLRDIYRGKITNWKQVGGPNLDITVLDRNEDESAKIVFRKYVLGPKLKITPAAVKLYYESDMVDGLLSTRGAIGYFSYGFYQANHIDVDVLALDGTGPSVESVKDGSYRMIRGLGVVTRKQTPPAAAAFVAYATGQRAADAMTKCGFAPYRHQ